MDTADALDELIDDTEEIRATRGQKEECLRILVHAKTVLFAAIQALHGDSYFVPTLSDDLAGIEITEKLLRRSIQTRERIAEIVGRG